MSWLYLVIIAQFINALVVLWDKYLVTSKSALSPVAYAFYVSILSGFVILFLPFGVIYFPHSGVWSLLFLAGFSFTFSVLFLYKALQVADASDVSPVAGAMAAIFSLILGFLVFKDQLSSSFYVAFTFLVIGTAMMSYFRFNRKICFWVLLSGILFGVSLVITKILFFEMNFVNGFFWSRLGNVTGGLLLLILSNNRNAITRGFNSSPAHIKYGVVANKSLAGLAFILILAGIQFGNVALVNALTGVQFVFLILFALMFSKKFPEYIYEDIKHKKTVTQKVIAVGLIVIGLAFLFL